jgi:hypothetical protein
MRCSVCVVVLGERRTQDTVDDGEQGGRRPDGQCERKDDGGTVGAIAAGSRRATAKSAHKLQSIL